MTDTAPGTAPEKAPEPAPPPEPPANTAPEPPTGNPAPSGEPAPPPDPIEQAFDGFYHHTVRPLTRQVTLLTGDPELTRRAVEHAYCTAWQRWTEVARDPSPEGWLRPVAYDYALAPWRQLGLATPSCPIQRAMRALPLHHRRAVLLYNGLGLDLPDTAAELEATTAATGGRLIRAHAALAGSVSGLSGKDPRTRAFSRRLGTLLEKAGTAVDVPPPTPPSALRARVHEHAKRRMLATAALVAAFLLSTATVSILTAGGTAPPESPAAQTRNPHD